jgi:hypothetical protein
MVQYNRNVDLEPESKWIVTVTETQVSCRRPSGLVESVDWDDLRVVLIETTDDGPFAADVFWMLAGDNSGCVVPLGAAGEDEMIAKLQALPGFNNEAVIEAMSSTGNRSFLCWRRSDAA